MSAEPDHRSTSGVERVVAFSDGVFAIAITLLVLPLAQARFREGHVEEDLLNLLPEFGAFALSFAVIGRFWRVHHRGFLRIARADGTLLTLNLVFLFWVAVLPFPTAVLGQHGDSVAAVLLYALSIILTGLSSSCVWWYAARGRPRLRQGAEALTHPDTDPREIRTALARGLGAVSGFVPSLGLAFLSTTVAEFSWLLAVPLTVLAARLAGRRRD
ncbi:putative integral membrane protein [Saccharomonospora marina XMU15]|uniref:Putative integral membrane protein n=1 Tax=Saccharomonospora marina XMU15 TaxID=882083 RepID=H5XAV8_9PSEU|nr:TMEM175 family protein [Saccharomonospora marina]EHR52668.1 putative integral membrane protein [Saccharomonospora marina XMU15]